MSNSPHRAFLLFSVSLLLLVTGWAQTAPAVTMDWNAATWTPGSLSNSYDIDAANPGNDITITVSGNAAQLQPELVSPNPQTPAITTDLQGGMATPKSTLCLAVDFSNASQSITVTVDFSALYAQGVQNVSFTIFDVDAANVSGSTYQDRLSSITAVGADGTTLIAPTITTSADNTLSGTGLSQVVVGTASTVDTGAGSGAANVTISFGANAIRSFTFTYGGSSPFADPTYQHIGISDISFTPVPEMNPAISASLSCLVALGLTVLLRRRTRPTPASD